MKKKEIKKLLEQYKTTTDEQKNPELLVDVSYILKDTATYDKLKKEAKGNFITYHLTKKRQHNLLFKHFGAVAVGFIILFLHDKFSGIAPSFVLTALTVSLVISVLYAVFTATLLIFGLPLYFSLIHINPERLIAPSNETLREVAEENKQALRDLFVKFIYKNNHNESTLTGNTPIELGIKIGEKECAPPNGIQLIGGYQTKEGIVTLFLTLRFNIDCSKLTITDYVFSLIDENSDLSWAKEPC